MGTQTSTADIQAEFWATQLLLKAGGLAYLFADGRVQDRRLLAQLSLPNEVVSAPTLTSVEKALAKHLSVLRIVAEHLPRKAPLFRNLGWLADSMGLDELEREIVLLVALGTLSDILAGTLELMGPLRLQDVHGLVSVALAASPENVSAALSPDGKLVRSGLIWVSPELHLRWECKVGMLYGLTEQLVVAHDDPALLLRSNFHSASGTALGLDDFQHLGPDIEVLRRLLVDARNHQRVGVNVLVYGNAGCGKTTLTRVLADSLGSDLFDVASHDRFGNSLRGEARLGACSLAQEILGGRDQNLLVLDEAEGIFRGGAENDSQDSRNRSIGPTKARINQLLETNRVPTLWLTNSLAGMDAAYLRRFSLILQVDVPPRSVRARLLRNATCDLGVTSQWLESVADHDDLSPALVTQAAEVARRICTSDTTLGPEEVMTLNLNGHFRALGQPLLREGSNTVQPPYRLDFLNVDADLEALVEGIRRTGRGRICCWGSPGTGKSAFGLHLAQALDRPILLRRASDLISKWVGDTERAISRAFEEAKQEGAVLQLDEVDGFLQNREKAQHGWEVTQVNEMLTQLESFQGILIATTNRLEAQDDASLRRFDVKIRFDPLKPAQQVALLEESLQVLQLECTLSARRKVSRLANLTPGDYAVVFRQHGLNPVRSGLDFVARLVRELELKRDRPRRSIGFGGGA